METRFAAARAGMGTHGGVGLLLEESWHGPLRRLAHVHKWQKPGVQGHTSAHRIAHPSGACLHSLPHLCGLHAQLPAKRCPEDTSAPHTQAPHLPSEQRKTGSQRFRAGRMELERTSCLKPSCDRKDSETLVSPGLFSVPAKPDGARLHESKGLCFKCLRLPPFHVLARSHFSLISLGSWGN